MQDKFVLILISLIVGWMKSPHQVKVHSVQGQGCLDILVSLKEPIVSCYLDVCVGRFYDKSKFCYARDRIKDRTRSYCNLRCGYAVFATALVLDADLFQAVVLISACAIDDSWVVTCRRKLLMWVAKPKMHVRHLAVVRRNHQVIVKIMRTLEISLIMRCSTTCWSRLASFDACHWSVLYTYLWYLATLCMWSHKIWFFLGFFDHALMSARNQCTLFSLLLWRR